MFEMRLSEVTPMRSFVVSTAIITIAVSVLHRFHLLGDVLNSSAFQVILFTLAIDGIIFGAVQFRDAWRLRNVVQEIAESSSTHCVGTFPKHVDKLVEVVGRAKHELLILTDCVDYGSYAAPEAFERLKRAVQEARARNVHVHFRVCGPPAPLSRSNPYYNAPFEDIRKSPDFEQYFRKSYSSIFHQYFPNDTGDAPINREQLVTILNGEQQAVMKVFEKIGVQFDFLPDVWPDLFFWAEDAESAMFVFTGNKEGRAQGVAWWTRDSKLIEALGMIFNSAREARRGAAVG